MIITYVKGKQALSIEFDAMMRSSDVSSSTLTAHPIETGSPVNDHLRKNADSLSFDAVVSNSPLRLPSTNTGGAQAVNSGMEVNYQTVSYDSQRNGTTQDAKTTASVLQFDRPFNRVRDVYDEIKYIEDNCLPVGVRTMYLGGFRDYSNMAILNVTVPTDVADGDSRTFSFQLQHIRFVDTKKVKAPKAKKTVKKGEKPKKEVKTDEDAKLKSDMLKLGDAIGNAAKALAPAFGL